MTDISPPGGCVYRVRLFALLQEKAGTDVWVHESPSVLTGSALLNAFFDAHPDLEALRHVTRLAVNQAFCVQDARLDPADELALIPPVSGG